MKYFFYILIAAAVYFLFAYCRILYFVHYSKNPDIVQSDMKFGVGPALRYIAAGDSTALGQGASSVEQTYPYKIAQELGKTNTVEYRNIAVRGARTADVINNQLAAIKQFNPDVVTISIGANDATHLVSGETILENYRTIIETLLRDTHAKIYITDIANFNGAHLLPTWYIRLIENRSAKINPAIAVMSRERVGIVNIHDFGWDRFPDRSVTYSFDHFHPSDMGYQNWADAFFAIMNR